MTIRLTAEQFEVLRRDQLRANPPQMMTPQDAAIFFDLNIDTVYSKIALGELPSEKIGTRVYVPYEMWRAKISAAEKGR